MRLSHKDFEALQRAILELHEHHDMATFRRDIPPLLLRLVNGDYFLLSDYQLDPARETAQVVDFFESDPRWTPEAQAFGERRAFAHPFTQYFLAGGAPTALKQSDFLTGHQFANSSWGEGLDRYTGINRMISLPVTSGQGNACVINIGRRGRDYDERDRLMLNLIRPHYDQACRNIQFVQALQPARPEASSATSRLTPRETEVARWLALGKTNPEIATILSIEVRTVEKHMERVLEKVGAENRTVAALMIAPCLRPNSPSPRPLTRQET
jgi:DNA-binding CsgD family transcriptional regulator